MSSGGVLGAPGPSGEDPAVEPEPEWNIEEHDIDVLEDLDLLAGDDQD